MLYDATQTEQAWNRLRMAVRNEQQAQRVAEEWRKREARLRRVYAGSANVSNNASHRR